MPIAFSSNHSLLASGCPDGEVRLWLVSDDSCTRSIIVTQIRSVRSMAFTPYGVSLAAGGFGSPSMKLRLE